jgi:hypothetical protein
MRLLLLRFLTHVAHSTDVFLPLAPFLLEVRDIVVHLDRARGGGAGPPARLADGAADGGLPLCPACLPAGLPPAAQPHCRSQRATARVLRWRLRTTQPPGACRRRCRRRPCSAPIVRRWAPVAAPPA